MKRTILEVCSVLAAFMVGALALALIRPECRCICMPPIGEDAIVPLLIDFEAKSRADLKKVGGRLYWEDDTSEVLVAAYYDTEISDPTKRVGVWYPGMPCPIKPGMTPVAHGAENFDRFAANKLWGTPLDCWIDTSKEAKKAGLPGALDALGSRWLDIPKDKAASKFTKGLSSCRRPADRITADEWRVLSPYQKRRQGKQPDISSDDMARVQNYCLSDVEIMALAWDDLVPWFEVDADATDLDRVINDRGVGFDARLAKRLLECDSLLRDEAIDLAARKLYMSSGRVLEIANSPAQFTEFTGAENAQKETVAVLAERSDRVGTMARARQALASIARGKLEAGLRLVNSDGRLRDTHVYYGGHTGRWSSRGMQLQNLPRPADRFEGIDVSKFAREVMGGEPAGREEIDFLLRGTICAEPGHTFVVLDFSGIEARGLAWAADDHKALDVLTSPRDAYIAAAAGIFGVPYESIGKKSEKRAAGKVAELACGYQGGHAALTSMATKLGIDLSNAGKTPHAIVKAWRKDHAPTVRLWYAVQKAFVSACRGRESTVSCFKFVPSGDGDAVAAILPSGRPIVYDEIALSRGQRGVSISYQGRDPWRDHLYGGKLVENLIQAMCRDLLADVLLRAERAGLPTVMHVHDEAVIEVPRSQAKEVYAELSDIMTAPPEWAHDMPINADGFIGRRYKK